MACLREENYLLNTLVLFLLCIWDTTETLGLALIEYISSCLRMFHIILA